MSTGCVGNLSFCILNYDEFIVALKTIKRLTIDNSTAVSTIKNDNNVY